MHEITYTSSASMVKWSGKTTTFFFLCKERDLKMDVAFFQSDATDCVSCTQPTVKRTGSVMTCNGHGGDNYNKDTGRCTFCNALCNPPKGVQLLKTGRCALCGLRVPGADVHFVPHHPNFFSSSMTISKNFSIYSDDTPSEVRL